MDLTFLGHQSWLLSENNTHILVDPVLSDKFGYDTIHGIEIYPPRTIDIKGLPKIDAIVISHEHSDHFHLPSLLHFKETPIYVGRLMPSCVTELLVKVDLKVFELDFQQAYKIGDLEITLYPRGNGTAFWESRVTQVLVQSLKTMNASVFIAVDALVSSKFKEDIDNEIISRPTAIIVANNSQIPPKGVSGSLDNCHTDSISKNKGVVGLQILSSMLISYLQGIEEINDVIICGGGFMKSYDTFFGPFQFSNQQELAHIAQELSTGKNIYGPLPGEVITIENTVSISESSPFVNLDKKRLLYLNKISEAFRSNPKTIPIKSLLGEFLNDEEYEQAKSIVSSELSILARAIMLSSLGEKIIDTHESGKSPHSQNRFLIKFLSNGEYEEVCYCLDLNKAKFVLVKDIESKSIPFGIELYLKDFSAMLQGKIQIWDLAGIGMRSWYIGKPLESPIGFLYSWYGEQVQTENNFNCYLNRWSNILYGTKIEEQIS